MACIPDNLTEWLEDELQSFNFIHIKNIVGDYVQVSAYSGFPVSIWTIDGELLKQSSLVITHHICFKYTMVMKGILNLFSNTSLEKLYH